VASSRRHPRNPRLPSNRHRRAGRLGGRDRQESLAHERREHPV
jgi:hypothetical protein